MTSLFARRQTNQTTQRLNRGLTQLASGLRINRASDDAAGLAIAEGFRSSVLQLNQEAHNIQSGIALARTTDGGLESQQGAIQRIRELSVQSANGTLNDDQRAALNAEAQQLVQQIDETARNTEFNGVAPLDGGLGPVALDGEGDVQFEVGESTVASQGLTGIDISTAAGAVDAIDRLDAASEQVSAQRASIGAQESRFEAAIESREIQSVNEQDAESRIRDLDVARAVVEQTRNEVLLQAGVASILQGNVQSETAVRLLGG